MGSDFVQYKRLGTFYYVCGVLGHTDRTCEILFDQENDDGQRGRGASMKPKTCIMETSASNNWLKYC